MVTMSAVWDRTSEFLSDNLGPVAGIGGLTLYVPGVVREVVSALAAVVGPGGKLALGLLSLVLSLIGLFGSTALTALALEPALGSGGAFRRAAARLPATIGVSLVLLVAALLLTLPLAGIAIAGGVDPTAPTAQALAAMAPGMTLLMAFYMLVLTVLLLWASARLAAVGPVVVAERRGLGAIGRAFALTRGAAARIFGVVLLFVVVAGVAELAAELVFGSIFRLAFGSEGPINPASVLTAVVVALAATALSIVLPTFLAKLYLALRDRADSVPRAA